MEGSVFVNIIFFEAILVVINLPAILLGFKFEGNSPAKRLWFEPPALLIPLVWVLLFGLLAVLQFKLFELEVDQAALHVFTLVIVSAMYPYYTLGLEKATGISAVKFGLLGNALILIISLWLAAQVGQVSPQLAYFVLPVMIWTAFTTFVLLGRQRLMKSAQLE